MRCSRKCQTIALGALISILTLGCSIAGAIALLPACLPRQSFDSASRTSAVRASSTNEQSWLTFHVDIPKEASFREQHLHQEILAVLLKENASQLPDVSSCELKVRFLDGFGDFAVGAGHSNPARRLVCLRGAINYLLNYSIGEFDFGATKKDNAYWTRMGYSSQTYAEPLALAVIYEKHSPLHEIHSISKQDLSQAGFEQFDSWLRRIRERRLITFAGDGALLDALGLPLPDPMVLVPVPTLKSPRVPAGVLFFESELVAVPALIMLSIDANDQDPVDRVVAERLGCSADRHPRRIASAGSAIASVSCYRSNWFGDGWLSFGIGKSDAASYQEFCRQVRALINDPLVKAAVLSSLEGSKGLYVVLARRCEKHE